MSPRERELKESYGPARKTALDLNRLSRRLDSLSFQIAIFTAANIGCLFASAISTLLGAGINTKVALVGISGALTISSFLFLFIFDSHQRRGNAMFEELSDELQWYIRKFTSPTEVVGDENKFQPPIELRTALKMYTSTRHLPFTSRTSGAAVYAIVNLIVAAALIVIALLGKTSYY